MEDVGGIIIMLIYLVILVALLASMWVVVAKAGKPGWLGIIPIVNIFVLLDIAGKPMWWFILFLIPIVNLIFSLLWSIALAERFGKGAGFGIGLWLLGFIFFPILAFSDAQYTPPEPAAA